ncbi:Uncharacterized protein DAT39_023486, partial [Clarias magur]
MTCGEIEGEQVAQTVDSNKDHQQEDVQSRRRGRGAVLPESQTEFLEEIIEFPSISDPVISRQKTPPQQNFNQEPDPCRVSLLPCGTCTVATMTEQLTNLVEWGDVDKEESFPLSDQGSPKPQRVSLRLQRQPSQEGTVGQQNKVRIVPTEKDREQSQAMTEQPLLFDKDQLMDLDGTPPLRPQVLLHDAQVHRDGGSVLDLLEDLQDPITQDQTG